MWVVAVGPGAAEPPDTEVEVALTGYFVFGLCAVGFVVVSAVLEGDASTTLELLVVPFRNFGVCEQCMMATKEACFVAACYSVWRWIVLSRWVVRVLPSMCVSAVFRTVVSLNVPVAVLWLVDREPLVDILIIPRNDEFGVVKEVVNDPTIRPSSVLVEERERCIPVEECYSWVYALRVHLHNHIIVVLDSVFIDRTMTERKEARP